MTADAKAVRGVNPSDDSFCQEPEIVCAEIFPAAQNRKTPPKKSRVFPISKKKKLLLDDEHIEGLRWNERLIVEADDRPLAASSIVINSDSLLSRSTGDQRKIIDDGCD